MSEDGGSAPPRLRREPAERAVRAFLPACAGLWTAAEIMHVTGIPWLDITWGTLTAGAAAYGRVGHRDKDRRRARRRARHAAAGILAAGAWTAAATRYGPLAGPRDALTLTWAAGSLGGWGWLRRHEMVVAARDWRHARADFLHRARRWGVGGAHLLEHERTRLGRRMVLDVKGTGRRASQLARGDVAERIAEDEGIPVSRVQVRPHRLAGWLEVSIREADPWAHPIPHPVLAEDPELDLSGACTCREPFIIGQDPETGRPLTLPAWDEDGGKRILIVATSRAGKTVLLSCLRERGTKARDVLVVDLNLSKALEDKEWAPACHLTAITRRQRARALKILRILCAIIEWRSQQPRATAVFQPSPSRPLILLIGDEIDALSSDPAARPLLKYIFSKGGSEGVASVIAGQRGTADWIGGGDVRALVDVFCLGQVNRRGEMMHAAGDLGLTMPDMATYGEGHKGVWTIAELGGDMQTGRTFLLKEPGDLRKLAEERALWQPDLEPELKAFLGKSYENLLSEEPFARWAADQREHAPAATAPRLEGGQHAAPVAVITDSLAALDREAEDYLNDLGDDDLRAKLRRMAERDADTARILNETARMPMPAPPDPGKLAAHTAARWQMVGEGTEIPGDARETLLRLLAEGTTIARVAEALGVSRWTGRRYLERLRVDGLARIEGSGRSARWLAASDGP